MEKEIVIIAGANGVGKTTFARAFLNENDFEFLNADEIAREQVARNVASGSVSAGKEFFRRLHDALTRGDSVLIESTLAGRYVKRILSEERRKEYRVTLIFLFVDSPEILIERIVERVRKGGHFVPDEDVRRRFGRGIANFWRVYKDLLIRGVCITIRMVHLRKLPWATGP